MDWSLFWTLAFQAWIVVLMFPVYSIFLSFGIALIVWAATSARRPGLRDNMIFRGSRADYE